MTDIGPLAGIPANQLQVIDEFTEDDLILGLDAPAGSWRLVGFTREAVKSSVGGGGAEGGSGGNIDGGNAGSNYGGVPVIDCGGA